MGGSAVVLTAGGPPVYCITTTPVATIRKAKVEATVIGALSG
jgi:hypothetical protein